MKRKLLLFTVVLAITSFSINTSYGLFGTETWTQTVEQVACSASGSGAAAAGGGSASISGAGQVIYAHYLYDVMSCPGWAWGCYDAGAVPRFLGIVSACPS